MSSTFGRRALPTYTAPPREPAIPSALREALGTVKRPQKDPEFAAWTSARAVTRWKIWGMCFLVVLGGPMAYFLPDGVGQIAGIASSGAGIVGLVMRLREKAKPEDKRKKQEESQSRRKSYGLDDDEDFSSLFDTDGDADGDSGD